MQETPLTYMGIITNESRAPGTNHVLNSVLMKVCRTVLGNSEFVLRLPNLAAHVVFMCFSILWLHAFVGGLWLLPGFILLNANPYTIEFFSLARGYGLAMTFTMGATYCLHLYMKQPRTRWSALAFTLAAFAVLSNFAWLNLYLSMVVAFNLGLLGKELERASCDAGMSAPLGIIRHLLRENIPVCVVTAVLAAIALNPIRMVLATMPVLIGGDMGLFVDTICSLVRNSTHHVDYGFATRFVRLGCLGCIALPFLATLFLLLRGLWDRRYSVLASPAITSCFIIIVALAGTSFQHHFFGTKYLQGRTALFLVPVFTTLLLSSMAELADIVRARRVAAIAVCGLSIVVIAHFAVAANLSYTTEYYFDQQTKQMMRDVVEIADDNGESDICLGVSIRLWPSAEFYQKIQYSDRIAKLVIYTNAPRVASE